ncbi:hypothetical protein U1Q18_040639 [Sarracenia purpurea var. burkii]
MAIIGLIVLMAGDTPHGWRQPKRFQKDNVFFTTHAETYYLILQQRVPLLERNRHIHTFMEYGISQQFDLQCWSQACLLRGIVYLEMVWEFYANSANIDFDSHSLGMTVHGVRIMFSATHIYDLLCIPLVSNPQFPFAVNTGPPEVVINWELTNGTYNYPTTLTQSHLSPPYRALNQIVSSVIAPIGHELNIPSSRALLLYAIGKGYSYDLTLMSMPIHLLDMMSFHSTP